MRHITYISIFSLLFLMSCANSDSATVKNTEKPFFDLKGFFEKEIANQQISKVIKTVKINEKSETKTLTNFDLESELKLFIDCDINKPSLFDKYEQEDATKQKTVYTALDEDLKVQRIEIINSQDEENTVESIVIHKKANTQIYNSDKVLTYRPKKGFSIKNTQKVFASSQKDYEIEVVFE